MRSGHGGIGPRWSTRAGLADFHMDDMLTCEASGQHPRGLDHIHHNESIHLPPS